MASNLRVDTILPSTGTSLGIGTASGTTTVTNHLNVTGNLGVAGVLTYEDVTNVDSVGVITARSGINLTGGVINSAGNINCTSGRFQRGSATVQDGDAIAGGININGTDMDASVIMSVFGNDGDFTRISGSKSRNASVGSHTIVQNNDVLLSLKGFGSDGTNFEEAAQIEMQVDGTPGNNVMPGRIVFKTATTDGVAERLRISSQGYVTKPNHPSFHARPPASYTTGSGSDTAIGGTWSTSSAGSFVRGTLANGNSIWNNTNGIFTVPVTGIYYLHWSVFLTNNTTRRDAMIYVNGTGGGNIIARTEIGTPNSSTANNKSVSVTTVVSLSVNDTVRFGALNTGGTTIYQTVVPWSYACGHLIG